MSTRIIKINRGDSFEFTINVTELTNSDETYLLASNEAIYFALMYPHQPFEKAFLLKGYTLEDQDPETGNIVVKLYPIDTYRLTPGVYYYNVKLRRANPEHLDTFNNIDMKEEMYTLIERTKFIINE